MRDYTDRDLARMFALDDAPGPARPVDEARSAAIIAGALGGVGFPPVGGGGGAGGAHGAGPSSAAKGLAAGKLTVLAGGAAAVAIAAATWLALRSPPPAPAKAVAVVVAPRPEPPAASEPAAPSPLPEPADPTPAAQPASIDPPHAPAPTKRPAPRHHRRAEPVVTAATPEDLLAEANTARAARRWRAADALYSRVIAGGSADLAVQTALVASATLHLEHLGDPSGAARRFSAALAAGPRDALAEDARWGLVESARALDDDAGELRALDDFLAHHAGSPLAARARARRAQLGAAR
jgi:hypothetical protein